MLQAGMPWQLLAFSSLDRFTSYHLTKGQLPLVIKPNTVLLYHRVDSDLYVPSEPVTSWRLGKTVACSI